MSMSKRGLRLVMMVPYVPVLKNSQLAKEKCIFENDHGLKRV